MCGIAGFVGKKRIEETVIKYTLNLMKNRGPDTQQYIFINLGNMHGCLLHSRLSIIDLDKRSNQPFTIDDCTLIFNGEIYNYIELREELQYKGVVFKTNSDTEVLLWSYIIYGEDCVHKFEGMWSFAIYDLRKRIIFLSRDRFAEKPLYYVKLPEGIYFGSETKFLKSLMGNKLLVNEKQLLRYLVNGYKSLYKGDETFFEGVKELSFATNMVIDSSLNIRTIRYWKPQYNPCKMSLGDAVEGIKHHLFESVKIRLRSDVPLAFCLSGGVDSASLASIAAKRFNKDISVFSIIDSDERYNEYDNIMLTVNDLRCEYNLIEIPKEEGLPRLKRLIEYHDMPIFTPSYYVHSLLSQAISNRGYRVAVSGTGADELFTGYYDHFLLHLYEIRNHPDYNTYLNDWQKYIQPVVRNPSLRNPCLYFKNPEARDHVFDNADEFSTYTIGGFNAPFTEEKFCGSLLRNRMMNEIFVEATRVILHEDDLNSMEYSVENRSPYLDRSLFEFTYSIPGEYLIHNGFAKYLLREAVKGVLNDKVRLTRQKKGFNASINSIVNFKNKQNREYLLDNGRIFDLIERSKVENLMSQYPLANSYSKFLFNFINAKIFLELNG